jgi:hypothetical protein
MTKNQLGGRKARSLDEPRHVPLGFTANALPIPAQGRSSHVVPRERRLERALINVEQ